MRLLHPFNQYLYLFPSYVALFLIYSPLAISGYYCYGEAAESSIVNTISHGGLRITAEICFLVHLVAAFPIVFNPGAQYFEDLMKIPSSMIIINFHFFNNIRGQ